MLCVSDQALQVKVSCQYHIFYSRSVLILFQAIIIITDGKSDASTKRLDIASYPLRGQKAKDQDGKFVNAISILAISVGNDVNKEVLKQVVTPPIYENVFLAANYADMYNSLRKLAEESCEFKSGNDVD